MVDPELNTKRKVPEDNINNSDDDNDNNDGNEENPTKRIKKDKSGQNYVELGNNKRVSVSEFRGKTLVNIREYYENKLSGEMLPGKKGICLNIQQWKTFVESVEAINNEVKKLSS